MKLLNKALITGAIAAAAIATVALPANAMDCVVVNRSTQGAIGASNSSQWALIDVNAALSGCLSDAQLAQVDAALTQAGLPLVFDTRTDTTLPDNGHGILHIDETYIPIIFGIAGPAAGPCLGG